MISNEGSIDGSVDLLSISILKERKRFFERKGGHFSNERVDTFRTKTNETRRLMLILLSCTKGWRKAKG